MGMFINHVKALGVEKISERAPLLKRVFDSHGVHGEPLAGAPAHVPSLVAALEAL